LRVVFFTFIRGADAIALESHTAAAVTIRLPPDFFQIKGGGGIRGSASEIRRRRAGVKVAQGEGTD